MYGTRDCDPRSASCPAGAWLVGAIKASREGLPRVRSRQERLL
jgi:hypothetical protein